MCISMHLIASIGIQSKMTPFYPIPNTDTSGGQRQNLHKTEF